MTHRRNLPQTEKLEQRALFSVSPNHHVLIISVDGLHQADVADPNLSGSLKNIHALQKGGVTYANAATTRPSDSFPGTLSYLTGAGPGTTGVFYDDSYDRNLHAPGTSTESPKGTEVAFAENLDKNQSLLSGGGNFDASSIDPSKLPIDDNGHVVYPHQFLKVNTIFNVARDAGLYTAFGDKHPAYDIANGPTGNGINDYYSPEINSMDALYDSATGKTVNADALLAANPFADVSKYTLVDASTDPVARDPKTGLSTDPNLDDPTKNTLLCERYDDLKVQAAINEINGLNSRGTHAAPVPNLFGFNFQEVSVAEKYAKGGITILPNGQELPSKVLESALTHADAAVGRIVAALKARNLWSSTLLVLTAKHGQNPRVGSAGLMKDSTLPDVVTNAGAAVAQVTQDDASLIWLQDQGTTSKAVAALKAFRAKGTIEVYFKGVKQTLPASKVLNSILYGKYLADYGLGDPSKNSRTPDVIVTLKPGYVWVGNPTKFTFKNGEHGGFQNDDFHVALITSGGIVPKAEQGQTVAQQVLTTQIAVTALNALGLDAMKLQGAVADRTAALPGMKG